MDYAQARAILDKYGEDKCLQIIFDNGRVWLTCVAKDATDPVQRRRGYKQRDANGKLIFYKFSELVELDEATDSIKMREYQHGVDVNTRNALYWDIVNPIEGIQGFTFVPPDYDEEQEYILRSNFDVSIT